MNGFEQSICDAINIIVDQKVSQAGFDKTIQAKVVTCEDATIGKYKIEYQDSLFYAYANNSEVTYTPGSNVYILIPNGDFTQEKSILGTTRKLGINYISVAEGDEAFEYVGNNCVQQDQVFNLSSHEQDENKRVQILYNAASEDNFLKLDVRSIEEYIKNSSSLICGAEFKTALPAAQQYNGNYGLIFGLAFTDNNTRQEVLRYYTVDVDNMKGNPYKLSNFTRQYGIFDIDGPNFVRVDSISAFVKDFPIVSYEEKDKYNIFISDIEFYGAKVLTSEELSTYSLSFYTPQGSFFTGNENETDLSYLTLEAIVKVKGKIMSAGQSIDYYWFVENAAINTSSIEYCRYGGQGWKCLNSYNILAEETYDEDGTLIPAIVEWVPGSNTWMIQRQDVPAAETRYKCVVSYDNTFFSKEIVIKNYASNYKIEIVSDEGNIFYFDNGHPTLTCTLEGGGLEATNLSYYWAKIDNRGTYEALPETTDLNKEFAEAWAEYTQILEDVANDKVTIESVQARLTELENNYIKNYLQQRVKGNQIIRTRIGNIVGVNTFICTVNNEHGLLGTASIKLYNSLSMQNGYDLVINNGAQTFQYNENGVSPASGSLEKPLPIEGLSFTLYDHQGKEVDNNAILAEDVKWIIPIEDTMLEVDKNYDSYKDAIDATLTYMTYKGTKTFNYGIAARYDFTKRKNNIKLSINYQGQELTAHTDFTFVKQGDPGTNGSDIVCKIIPNMDKDEIPVNIYTRNKKFNTSGEQNQKFMLQLWKDGKNIFEGSEVPKEGLTLDGGTASLVVWSRLTTNSEKNKNNTNYNIESGGYVSYVDNNNINDLRNIIKASITYNKKTSYAFLPIITVEVNENYDIRLKDYTGFKYVLYDAGGRNPKYDNSYPFEVELFNNNNENISNLKDADGNYLYNYTWSVTGDELILREAEVDTKHNQQWCKPTDSRTTANNNLALICTISHSDGTEIGTIHIPIHYALNVNGIASLNDWDGSSIKLDNNNGAVLAPQVGAGEITKDGFTGLLMGKVNYNSKDQTGLIGFKNGLQTIFMDATSGETILGKSGQSQIKLIPDGTSYIGGCKLNAGSIASADNDNWYINKNGKVKFKDGEIGGCKIGGSSISTDGWSINSSGSASFSNVTITGGSIKIGDNANINSSGNATFHNITCTGTINATGGYLGKSDNSITSSGFNFVGGTVGLGTAAEGNNGISYKNGKVTISGDIYANSGIFSGTIKANDGNIGGWKISASGLSHGSKMKITPDAIWIECNKFQIYDDSSDYGMTGRDIMNEIGDAQARASEAKTAADAAQATADKAKTAADTAQATANGAKTTATAAKTKADENATAIKKIKDHLGLS